MAGDPGSQPMSFQQQVEATFDALDKSGTGVLPRHCFDAMLRLFGLAPGRYQSITTELEGWSAELDLEQTLQPGQLIQADGELLRKSQLITGKMCVEGEISRSAALKFFETDPQAMISTPRYHLLVQLFELMCDKSCPESPTLLLRDAQRLLRVSGLQTSLADFSLYTGIEVPQQQTGLFMDQVEEEIKANSRKAMVERAQELLRTSRRDFPQETIAALESLISNGCRNNGGDGVTQGLWASLAGEQLLHEIVQMVSTDCKQANGKQLAYLVVSSSEIQDKLGLVDSPVTVSTLAEKIVGASRESADGMVSTETFICLYSEAIEKIESDLEKAAQEVLAVDAQMIEDGVTAAENWATFLECPEDERPVALPEDIDDLIDEAAQWAGRKKSEAGPQIRRNSFVHPPEHRRKPSLPARRPSIVAQMANGRRRSSVVTGRAESTNRRRSVRDKRGSIAEPKRTRRDSFVRLNSKYRSSQPESEFRANRQQSVLLLQETRIKEASFVMDHVSIELREWLVLFSSVSVKQMLGRTRNLLGESGEETISEAQLVRVLEMVNRLHYLVCQRSLDGKFSVDALHSAVMTFAPFETPKAQDPQEAGQKYTSLKNSPGRKDVRSKARGSSDADQMKTTQSRWLLKQLKEMHQRLNAGEGCGKCTFIRMIGSDEEQQTPTQLILFVKQIRLLCAAYGLFDEDGGGTIDSVEFGTTLTKLFGWRPTRYETQKMMAMAVGRQHDLVDEIDWDGFIHMMTIRHHGAVAQKLHAIVESIGNFLRLFECFELRPLKSCCSLDMTVHPQDFCQILSATGLRYTQDELSTMLHNLQSRDAEIRGTSWISDTICPKFEIDFACFVNILTDREESLVRQRWAMVLSEMQLLFRLFVNEDEVASEARTITVENAVGFVTVLCGWEHREAADAMTDFLCASNVQDHTTISFPVFASLLAGCQVQVQELIWQQMGELREIYNLFDLNNSGEIDLAGFSEILKRFGGMEPHKIDEALHRFDLDGDGNLDFAEFTEMMIGGEDDRVVTQLTTHVEMLKEVFGIIEVKKTEHTGGFSPEVSAFSQALVIVGGMSKAEADAIAQEACREVQTLDQDSFLKLMIATKVDQQCDKFKRYLGDLRQAFQVFDTEGVGQCVIQEQELKVTFQLLGIELNSNDIRDILSSTEDANGAMSFGDYVALALPLVLQFRGADVFKDEIDMQSQVNKLREDFAAGSVVKNSVPVFNNLEEFEHMMALPSPEHKEELAHRVSQFLLDWCNNEAIRNLDPAARIELCKDVRMLRAAPHTVLLDEGDSPQYMLVVLRGEINVFLNRTFVAGTERHEMWSTVKQLLSQILPRLQLMLTSWPSTAKLSSRLIARTRGVEENVIMCIQDAKAMLQDGEELLCTEYADIWTKPSLIARGARLLAKLLALIDMSEECREQCTALRSMLIARKMQEDSSMVTIANIIDCIGDMLTELRAWKVPLNTIFGESRLPDAAAAHKHAEGAGGSMLTRQRVMSITGQADHLRKVGGVLQGQSFGASCLTSVHYGMEFEPAWVQEPSQLPLAIVGHTGDESGALVLAFSRKRLLSIISRVPSEFLQKQDEFKHLKAEPRILKRLSMSCKPGRYKFGAVVAEVGEPAPRILLLAEGQLKVIREDMKASESCRDTVAIISPDTTVDMVDKDSAGKPVQQYTLVADSADVVAWWMKRSLYEEFGNRNSHVMDAQQHFCSQQVTMIEQNSDMLDKTAVGKNEKLILEIESRNGLKEAPQFLMPRPPSPPKEAFDFNKTIKDTYEESLKQGSVSLTGMQAAEKVGWSFNLHKLGIVANPAPPKIPLTARPELSQPKAPCNVVSPLPIRQRQQLRRVGFKVSNSPEEAEQPTKGQISKKVFRCISPRQSKRALRDFCPQLRSIFHLSEAKTCGAEGYECHGWNAIRLLTCTNEA